MPNPPEEVGREAVKGVHTVRAGPYCSKCGGLKRRFLDRLPGRDAQTAVLVDFHTSDRSYHYCRRPYHMTYKRKVTGLLAPYSEDRKPLRWSVRKDSCSAYTIAFRW